MKRRGFLGFIGGAAIAGPSVAANAVKTLPNGFGGIAAQLGGGTYAYTGKDPTPTTSAGFFDWRTDEIVRLKRLISGEMTDEEREEKRHEALYALEPIVTQNVMALHSVSAHRKVSIFNRRMATVREDIERFYNRRRLLDLLKEV